MPYQGSSPEWGVIVPLSSLLALQELPGQMAHLKAENIQLRRELEALRAIHSQTLQLVADMKRSLHIR